MAFPAGTFVAKMVTQTPLGRRRNIFYFKVKEAAPTPSSAADVEKMCEAVKSYLGPLLAELMDGVARVEKVEGIWYSGDAASMWESVSTSAPINGAIAAAGGEEGEIGNGLLPDEVSLICRVRTGHAGRANRGRRFFTGLSESINDNGEIKSAVYTDAAKDLANALPTEINVDDYGPEEETIEGMLLPRHYNRKDNVLRPITAAYAIAALGTRKDRRKPLSLEIIA